MHRRYLSAKYHHEFDQLQDRTEHGKFNSGYRCVVLVLPRFVDTLLPPYEYDRPWSHFENMAGGGDYSSSIFRYRKECIDPDMLKVYVDMLNVTEDMVNLSACMVNVSGHATSLHGHVTCIIWHAK
jgi:hypothetical protein